MAIEKKGEEKVYRRPKGKTFFFLLPVLIPAKEESFMPHPSTPPPFPLEFSFSIPRIDFAISFSFFLFFFEID